MRRNSLRLRLVAAGAVAIVVALAVAGIALTLLFERHLERTVAQDLEVHLKQLLAGIDIDQQNKIVVSRPPADPRFVDPLSGLYWQISDDRDQLLRSRSLWDTTLPLPIDTPEQGETHHHEIQGPAGARLLVAERRIFLKFDSRDTPVRVAAAIDLARVTDARAAFATDLVLALGVLGLILAAATWTQVTLGLRPLVALRKGISDIRLGRSRYLSTQGPAEVRPLVDEVNALLDASENEIVRSRNRAADLAHGLKTPLAALAADGSRLRQKGEIEIADEIEAVIDAMRRHVDRELARARIKGRDRTGSAISTPLLGLVRSMIATLSRTATGAAIHYRTDISEEMMAPFDRTDLAEILGNLLENATRYAKSQVRITARKTPNAMAIDIEDDGPGIVPEQRSVALARGARLDERGDCTGLGLAIVQDVIEAYGWNLELNRSELGGLRVTCHGRRL